MSKYSYYNSYFSSIGIARSLIRKRMGQKAVIEPKQKRSIITKAKIKKVAKKLFSQKGYYTVTSNNIAAAAEVPIGSFYNYFGDKKGVLLELIDDFNEVFHEDIFDHNRALIETTTSLKVVLPHIESFLTNTLLSKHLANPFYGIIHALQFTESDVLKRSEEVRDKELEFLDVFLERINEFHPISNISVKAKIIHSIAENVGLYIHHLGTNFEKKILINETATMIYKYIS